MMELGERSPFNEEDCVKEEEIFWNFDNNIEMVDPLKIEVKDETMNIKIESNYVVTSTQHENNGIIDGQGFIKEEHIIDDSKGIVTSSNQSISDVGSGPVLPTGLLLYRLFNQIIIDALLGTQVNCGDQQVPSRKPPPRLEPEIDVMTSTQNWVNRHEFRKGRGLSRKFSQKKGSAGELTVKNVKIDAVNNSLNNTENFIVFTENNSDLCEKQKCHLCDDSKNEDVHKNLSIERNDGSSSNKDKCTICDVDRNLNGLNYKRKFQYRNNNEYVSKGIDEINCGSNNHDDLSGVCDRKIQYCKDQVNDERNEIVHDTYRNVIRKCYVVINKSNVSDYNKYYVCSNCDNIFNNKIIYEKHKLLLCSLKNTNTKHINEINDYLCYVCGESFSQKTILLFEKHLKLHVAEEERSSNFSCRLCDKSTNSRSEFISHTKLHADKDNFVCNKCDKMFSNFNLLIVHNRKFHKNFKFSCDFCKSNFTNRINQVKHKCVKYESDFVKGHVCKICNKSFPRIVALNVHTNKEHVRVKSFSCSNCNKSFTRKSSLLSHSKLVHDGFYNEIYVKL